MKFIICAVGHKMPDWATAAFREYTKRMPHEASIELVEIKPEKRTGLKVEQLLDAEADRILAVIPSGRRVVAMDERGRQWSTAKLAESMSDWMKEGGDTVFIIGGADGLAAAIRNSADEVLALSALTLPHALARILLVEQLYRAISLIKGHPYHRG
jgi:23S rRNA (pseudouridine1915-N3)-methyltransferase